MCKTLQNEKEKKGQKRTDTHERKSTDKKHKSQLQQLKNRSVDVEWVKMFRLTW